MVRAQSMSRPDGPGGLWEVDVKTRMLVCCVAGLLTATAVHAAPKKGLYAEEDARIRSGDLNDQDYWWAKFDAMMLEEAIRTRQPEGHISIDLASSRGKLDTLVRKFPEHEEIRKWKARADEVAERIDEDKDRSVPYKPGFLWGEANYAQAWVNWHWANEALKANDAQNAKGLLDNVVRNLEMLSRPGRMDHYPVETRAWVEKTLPEAKVLRASLTKKTL